MNYCSIEDAWGAGIGRGKQDTPSNQIKEYMRNHDSNHREYSPYPDPEPMTFESFANQEVKPKPESKSFYNYDHNHMELYDCEKIMMHIKSCRKCMNHMRNQFKPQLIENFQDIIDENRDTIVLILIGISLLLFFNLISNITNK